jgi:hypothetical protein
MRTHGVPDFPDPSSSGGISKQGLISAEGEVSSAQVQAATKACQSLLVAAGGSLSGKPIQPITASQQQYYLNAAACMRSHGITNFPDPVFSGGSVSFPIPSSVDTNSPQFIKDKQTCEKLVPAGLPDRGSEG